MPADESLMTDECCIPDGTLLGCESGYATAGDAHQAHRGCSAINSPDLGFCLCV
jgi:hypothetical protein